MKTPNLTSEQYRRFELHIKFARNDGAKIYNAIAPDTILMDGDDANVNDAALVQLGLIHRDDGYYTFTQLGWDYARFLHS
jgi:hypothetical protein